MKTKKLEIRLDVVGNAVLMQVIHQDESLRSDGGCNILVMANGVLLRSFCNPQLKNGSVYIRGTDRSQDNMAAPFSFRTQKEAYEHVAKVFHLVDIVNEKVDVSEMTVAEISKALGKEVKVVK